MALAGAYLGHRLSNDLYLYVHDRAAHRILVSVLIHVWGATNLSGWFLDGTTTSYEPVLETKFTEPPLKTEVEEAIPFELANPNDREMEVREVTHAASLGIAQVMDAPRAASAAPPQGALAEVRLDVAKLPPLYPWVGLVLTG